LKTIIKLYISLISLSAYCQEGVIVPLNHSSDLDLLNGYYVKDIDNEFDSYVGTWQGTWGATLETKTFTLEIEKITHYTNTSPNGDYNYKDFLIGKYTVKETSTAIVITSTMAIIDPSLAKLESINGPRNNYLPFNYFDIDYCSVSGIVYLHRNLNNPNVLNYYFARGEFWISQNCPYDEIYDVPIPIPTINLTLSKIN
jgi:hypothetical protein